MSEKLQKATFGAGCFWHVEEAFRPIEGVKETAVGYMGGAVENPTYEQVCSGSTGHAEAIQIKFDPKTISFEKLLEIFFTLHDPTTLNRQGADYGTQYRSSIFYHDEKQKDSAEKVKSEIKRSGMYEGNIVTEIVPFKSFYEAENYHKNYYDTNKSQPYCQLVIDPKIQKLYKEFSKKTIIK